jgi:spore maturation protein SpmA/spore maturation protein SpmB
VLNAVFIALIVGAVGVAAWNGTMPATNQAALDAAKNAVMVIAFGLIGPMALWLGFMRVLREAGFMTSIARAVAPVMRRLFPDVPAEHPAMGAMVLNLAANVLGLGNAATPFGLKAMRELETLNPRPGVATNAMSLFLAINTAGVAVLPLGVIAIRSSLGSTNPAGIVIPTLLATACGTLVAVAVAKALQNRVLFSVERAAAKMPDGAAPVPAPDAAIGGIEAAEQIALVRKAPDPLRRWLPIGFAVLLVIALARQWTAGEPDASGFENAKLVLNTWLLPVLMASIVLFGFARRVDVYDAFIRGAREGFDIAIMIIPYLVAILVGVAMFRASGALGALTGFVSPVTSWVGFPAEALPMALIRPLSGSGGMAVMTETMTTHGPDSFVGYLVSVINGSTETTFYVLALYFGSVGVRATRHTVLACLAADFTGIAAALVFSRIFF